MRTLGWLGAALLAVAVIAGIVFGGWQLGWWFKTQNTNREAHLQRNSYAFQQTMRENVMKGIADYRSYDTQIAEIPSAAPQLQAQQHAELETTCQQGAQLTGDVDPSITVFLTTYCDAGAAK